MANWLIRSPLQYIAGRSPSDMSKQFGGSFVDGDGNAQSNVTAVYQPDTSAVEGQLIKYWVLTGDIVTLADQSTRDAIDVQEAADKLDSDRAQAVSLVTQPNGVGIHRREMIELLNKRDNYLVNRIVELQAALDAAKASSGAAQNIRDALPSSWLATNTRTRAQAISDYTDDINAGGAD